MYVIVVGAGEVGSYVADRLSREGHDVAIVDRDVARLRQLGDDLDVLTVAGSGTHPQVLERAGIADADGESARVVDGDDGKFDPKVRSYDCFFLVWLIAPICAAAGLPSD